RITDSIAQREVGINLTAAEFQSDGGEVSVIDFVFPTVTPASYKDGVFELSCPTVEGRRYTLEFSDQLPATNWTASVELPGNGSVVVFRDTDANHPQRFYRVRID